MRLTLLICLFCSTIAAYGASLDLQIDPTGNYYIVTGIDVSGINSTYYQPGASCSSSTVHSGLTILGPSSYTCSTESRDCRVPAATATRTDPSRIIATLIGARIPYKNVIGATGWRIQTNNGRFCTDHPSITPTRAIMAWTSNTFNEGPPEPPSCTVSDTSIVMSGGLGDTLRGSDTLAVSCDKPADVELAIVRSGRVDLSGGGVVSLTFRESGASSIQVSGLTASLTIDGILSQSPSGPGEYVGSTVVQVQYQ